MNPNLPHKTFIFQAYEFDVASKTAHFHYRLDDQLFFTERYYFAFDFVDYDPELLDRTLQLLFFVAGVSYYKTAVPPDIRVEAGAIDAQLAAFLSKTYQQGLGEFWYVNQLNPRTPITFPVNSGELSTLQTTPGEGLLVGVGGGKDSLLTIEILRQTEPKLTTWSLGHQAQLQPLTDVIGLPQLTVERTWDQQLLSLNQAGAFNGHVPISAIFACVGSVVSVLAGKHDAVVSNEKAANEPTLTYDGVAINHQYSKSQDFERDFQAVLQRTAGAALNYYSFLRPLSELYIAELFASIGFDKYQAVFSSCNRAFRHDSHQMFWCGECPKCAFVFMVLTPFVERSKLEALWHGKNLLLDQSLIATYNQLLGIAGDKPLECVGEIKESRAAMRLCQQQYPELNQRYSFELPADYDYKALGSDEMPPDIRSKLQEVLATIQ